MMLSVATMGSLYNPHLFPATGPFFEGWYTRISNTDSGASFGVIFGNVLPAHTNANASRPPVYLSIMRSGVDGGSMVSADCIPRHTTTTIRGAPVREDPNFLGEAAFEWNALGAAGSTSHFVVRANRTEVDFRCGSVTFTATIGAPVPWAAAGRGPAGELDRLPLPLHWFVYSLGSLATFRWADSKTGEVVEGGGRAHMEKNWGAHFPSAWTWSQAEDAKSGRVFAASGGPLFLGVPSYLVGYRSPGRGLSLDFAPATSLVTAAVDGCAGTLRLHARSLLRPGERLRRASNTTHPLFERNPLV